MVHFVDHQIISRRPEFDFSATPAHWVENDAFTTHVLNSPQVFIPELEYYFCRLGNQALPYIDDENLRADLKAFICQEANHANAHKAARAYLDRHKIDPSAFTAKVEWLLRNVVGDAPLRREKFFARHHRSWLAFRMGMIACWEHFFCFFGTWVLKSEALERVCDPVMLDLLRWHGAEEVEHRTVAFDAYRALAGKGLRAYVGRQVAMAFAFPLMIVIWLQAAAHLGRVDGTTAGRRMGSKSMLGLLAEFSRIGRTSKRLPSLTSIVFALALWLKPGHHPEHDGDVDAALRYFNAQ